MSIEIVSEGNYEISVELQPDYNIAVNPSGVFGIELNGLQGLPGAPGAPGAQGPQGIQGDPGPNEVTTSTDTNINAILYGNGSKVAGVTIGDGLTFAGGTLSAGAGGLKSGIATAAVTDVYTTTITGVTGYNTNDAYVIKFNTANSDGATLNINGLGAVQLVKNNASIITGGDIQVGQEFIVIYDGTNFQMIGIAPNQMFAFVTNADTVTITKGQVVYAFGASGDRMSVKLASNLGDATSAKTIGLVYSASIAANGTGFIITQGVIQGLNLGAYTAGDTLYLSATAGAFTKTKPYAPNHLVYVGIVERANAGNGQIYVRTQNGYELDEIHDVDLISNAPTNGQVLAYELSSTLWKNKTLTKSDVGLGNVDNTSDANKPISTATQTALNAKQDTLVSGTNIKTLENQSLLGSGNIDLGKSDVGLGNVDNTSDLNKPISTATQAAINKQTVGNNLYLFNNY